MLEGSHASPVNGAMCVTQLIRIREQKLKPTKKYNWLHEKQKN